MYLTFGYESRLQAIISNLFLGDVQSGVYIIRGHADEGIGTGLFDTSFHFGAPHSLVPRDVYYPLSKKEFDDYEFIGSLMLVDLAKQNRQHRNCIAYLYL
jgi:hypothetical protein